jgi:uncharacterized protein YegL
MSRRPTPRVIPLSPVSGAAIKKQVQSRLGTGPLSMGIDPSTGALVIRPVAPTQAPPNPKDDPKIHEGIRVAMARLAKEICPEILNIPVKIDDSKSTLACISADGIMVRTELLQKAIQYLHIIIAHEIFHPVIDDSPAIGFSMKARVKDKKGQIRIINIPNDATDYVINYHLKKLFGYDVRDLGKAEKGWEGLYNPTIGKMGVLGACQHLNKRYGGPPPDQSKAGRFDSQTRLVHPQILRVVDIIRRKFRQQLGDRKPLVHRDQMDRILFEIVSEKVRNKMSITLPISVEHTMEGLWNFLYQKKPAATELDRGKLTFEQAVTYGYPASHFRDSTVEKSDDAIVAASLYLRQVENDPIWISVRRVQAEGNVAYLKNKIKNFGKKAKPVKGKKSKKPKKPVKKIPLRTLRWMLVEAEKRLERYEKMKPVLKLLESDPIVSQGVVSAGTVVSQGSPMTLRKAEEARDTISLRGMPTLKSGPGVRRLKTIAHRSIADLKSLQQSLEQLIRMGYPVSSSGAGQGQQRVGNQGEGDGDSFDEATGKDTNGEGKTGHGEGNSQPEPGQPGQPGAGPGGKFAGKGRGSPTRVEIMMSLANNKAFLERVLFHMQEFATLISRKPSPRSKESESGADIRTVYGNELSQVAPEEIAKLAGTRAMQLQFFSDLANDSLEMRVPPDKKRTPIVLCLDASGSMHGEPYATAAGFALAMMAKLAKDKRGTGLIIFSHGVHRVIYANIDRPLNLQSILEAICRPDWGGTEFDQPLNNAFDLKEFLKWKSVLIQLVTDGECGLRNADAIRARKGSKDHISAVVVGNKQSTIEEVADSIYHIDKDGLVKQLADIGNRLL